jgi:hypothetical protein
LFQRVENSKMMGMRLKMIRERVFVLRGRRALAVVGLSEDRGDNMIFSQDSRRVGRGVAICPSFLFMFMGADPLPVLHYLRPRPVIDEDNPSG